MKVPLPLRLAGYRAEHAAGLSVQLPVNLTVSVTYRCASRCMTCDIWRKRGPELTVDDYARTFRSLRKVPVWVTVSGGDQFVRPDLVEVVRAIRSEIEPSVVNIPMNGVLTRRIHDFLPRIAEAAAGSELVLNLSVDGVGEEHDRIRGVPGSYAKMLELAAFIRDLQRVHRHVTLGVHTVVSRFNVARIGDIERELRAAFRPDSYITEVAERRVELDTTAKDITPLPADYRAAAAHLKASILADRSMRPVARLVQSLRLEYYDLAAAVLERSRQVIPCYAGWTSAQIAPDGDVWGCCVRAEPLGNLRESGFDFGAVWRSGRAAAFRASVRRRECFCPLANAAYTNMLLDAPSVLRVLANVAGVRLSS